MMPMKPRMPKAQSLSYNDAITLKIVSRGHILATNQFAMTARLTKLNSSLDDDRVVCVFNALQKSSNLLSKLHHRQAEPTKLTVYISAGIVTIERGNALADYTAADLSVVHLHEKSVVFHVQAQKATVHLDFASPLEALHFVGAVELAQQIDSLRGPCLEDDCCSLEHHMKQTLDYAERLWALDLWRQSASYYSFLDTLTCAYQELHSDEVHLGAIHKMLGALCDKFSPDVAIDQIVQVNGQTFHCISPLSVLVVKVIALYTGMSSS